MLMQARDYRPPESFVPGQVDSAEEVELAKINNELQQARQRYGSEHPKVRALEQQRDYWKKYLELGNRKRLMMSKSEQMASINEEIREQENNLADLEVRLIQGQSELNVAETELEAYLEGEFPMEKQNIEDAIKIRNSSVGYFSQRIGAG